MTELVIQMKKIEKHSKPFDWLQFAVRFFFGALFGSAIGFGLWAEVLADQARGWLCIVAAALCFGFIAAMYGDDFWRSLGDTH